MPVYQIIQHIKNIPKWYFGKSSNYHKLENIDPRGIYFLYDTGEIMNRGSNYNHSIILYDDGERPLIGSVDKLYINTKTLEGYKFENDTWIKVLSSLEDASSIDYEDIEDVERINGFGVNVIVDKFIENMKRSSIANMTWDENSNKLIYKMSSNIGYEVKVDGLVSRLEFDPSTRIATCYDDKGNIVSETELMDNHIIGGGYDDERKAIILKMRDGSEVRLKSSALLHIYTGMNTKSINIRVDNYIDGRNIVKGKVNISENEYNKLIINDDGIFSPSQLSLNDMEEGQMYKIAGEYIMPHVNISILATEAYVAQAKEDMLNSLAERGSVWLKRADVINTFNEVPCSNKVPSMYLINTHCGLKRL